MLIEFTRPDRCVVGTVGQPGNRLFLLQVAEGSQLVAVAVEKQQAQLLGIRVGEVLDQLADLGHDVPPAMDPVDMGPLDAPVEVAFRAAALGLAWDHERQRLLLELIASDVDDDTGENTVVQVLLTPAQAREFCSRATVIVASGRPACPACGQPLDPQGHICPRSNGYRGALFP